MIGRDQNIGKRFVVAQQHVEARPQPLDHVRFEQQRLGLGAGDDEFERARCRGYVEPVRANGRRQQNAGPTVGDNKILATERARGRARRRLLRGPGAREGG